jgi:hypothetical protein
MRFEALIVAWLWLVLSSPGPLASADENLVYTDPAHADEDFTFQGEYRGGQRSLPSQRSLEPVGLQVIARGNGRFDAVKYYAGLPGERRFRPERFLLSGERVGQVVVLIGEQYDIALERGVALLTDKDGRSAGELRKVQRISPTMGATPPAGAVVLFDGSDSGKLRDPRLTPEGWLLAGTETLDSYRSFHLHGEFRLPYKPFATGQARGNSGFYIQSRYEVQVLDSFGLEGAFNECGALYRQRAPDVNACLPPLQWQTFDIDFRVPRFDSEGKKVTNGRISAWLNGIPIHQKVEILDKTGAGRPEGPDPLPLKIQDHDNPVVFRNLWIVPIHDENAVGRLGNP